MGAVKALTTVWKHLRPVMSMQPTVVPGAKFWLYAYVLLQLPDEAKAMLDRAHLTSHVHHAVTGLGFLVDAVYGTPRTHALAVMSMASEVVAPAYQYYSWLKHRGLTNGIAAKRCAAAAILLTATVRLPICIWLFCVAMRDCYWSAMKKGGPIQDELQPSLNVPAVF